VVLLTCPTLKANREGREGMREGRKGLSDQKNCFVSFAHTFALLRGSLFNEQETSTL